MEFLHLDIWTVKGISPTFSVISSGSAIPKSIPNGDGTDGNSFNIQNLYAAYAVSDKFTLTAGYMGTFIGYEVISPLSNFHYSTSYLFIVAKSLFNQFL